VEKVKIKPLARNQEINLFSQPVETPMQEKFLVEPLTHLMAAEKKKILVVDDNELNRDILKRILESEYQILQAGDGQSGLHLLEENKDIALILLDITMPVMNGHEFLAKVHHDRRFIAIPIIVTTASNTVTDEVTCLGEGATDFITKPYNSEIVRHRVKSILRLCETSRLLSLLEYDQLTGVFTKDAFFQHTSEEIKKYPGEKYSVICCDICGFKLINEIHGMKKSDQVVKCLAECLRNFFADQEYILGRISSDIFAIFCKYTEKISESFFESFYKQFFESSPVKGVAVKFGVYHNIETSLSVSRICSRALLAIEQIKNDKTKHISFYVDWEKKQEFLNNFDNALEKKQFKLYLQAKWDVIDDCLGGAEALVRWSPDDKDTIAPGEFIPLLEETGIITQLDFYMWEEVCKLLYRWRATGKKLVPISVNMSRLDINTPDLVEKIQSMIENYDLPAEMIHFEILEDAYTKNPEKLIAVCNKLRNLGFKIEMDDFGTGSSSLNMLSILPIDYLKLDMKFLHSEDLSSKKSIISSIISLATWLDLEAIAEGVENKAQLDRLRNMGCRYVQGFYFSKPLSVAHFEEYVQNNSLVSRRKGDEGSLSEKERNLYKKFFAQKRCKVLIVEDLQITRETLCRMLLPYVDVIEACDGKEALEKLNEYGSEIDFVILDLILPVLDGFQVFKKMKRMENIKKIPVIITSENARKSELQAIKNGAAGFIAKPHNVAVVLHHIREVLIVNGIMQGNHDSPCHNVSESAKINSAE